MLAICANFMAIYLNWIDRDSLFLLALENDGKVQANYFDGSDIL